MRRVSRVTAMFALLLVMAGCIRDESYTFKGGELSPAQPAASIDLIDHHGDPFSLDDVAGQVTLIYFGYTTCPDLCPTTLSDFSAVKRMLGDDAEKVNFVLVTVDPERDNPARLEEYLAFFDSDFIGLTGDEASIEAAKGGYGVVATRVDYPDSATGYLVDHTSLIYVIDRDGNLRLTYPYGFDPESIAEDIRHLL
ncbi:MAG: SCO family protein [Thermomicrobiales bacterium]|nr:SCO family protein [Thermomicrobiales bacterium]